jgi:hypothetical protein
MREPYTYIPAMHENWPGITLSLTFKALMLVGKCAVVAGALNARSIGWHVADAWRAGEACAP